MVGEDDELGAVVEVEFLHGAADVGAGGGGAHEEGLADFVVGEAFGDEGEDFAFFVR